MSFIRYILYLLTISLVFIIVVVPVTYFLLLRGSMMMLTGVPLGVIVVMLLKTKIGGLIYRDEESVHKTIDIYDRIINFGAAAIFIVSMRFVYEKGRNPLEDSEALIGALRFALLFDFYLVVCAILLSVLRKVVSYFKGKD